MHLEMTRENGTDPMTNLLIFTMDLDSMIPQMRMVFLLVQLLIWE
jgi:hypothetical protein